jgi:hypothetical protein
MTDRDGTAGPAASPGEGVDEMNGEPDAPMDAEDLAILGRVVDLYEVLDPTPEMLPDLVLFSLQAVDLDAELARLVESELLTTAGAGARAVEQAKRVTFTSDHLTVMVAVSDRGHGSVRLDGWSTPGANLRAELRTGDTVMVTTCDGSGRFVFDDVPAGMAQLTLVPTAESDPDVTVPVVTPAIHL